MPPLRRATAAETKAIEEATKRYYLSRTPEDIADDKAIARASSKAARLIDYDAVIEIPNEPK